MGTTVAEWEFTMGPTAVIEADGTTIVVTSRMPPPLHGEQRTSVGVDAAEPSLIVAKDHVAWTPPTAT